MSKLSEAFTESELAALNGVLSDKEKVVSAEVIAAFRQLLAALNSNAAKPAAEDARPECNCDMDYGVHRTSCPRFGWED
jgi:hypothetical protein